MININNRNSEIEIVNLYSTLTNESNLLVGTSLLGVTKMANANIKSEKPVITKYEKNFFMLN